MIANFVFSKIAVTRKKFGNHCLRQVWQNSSQRLAGQKTFTETAVFVQSPHANFYLCLNCKCEK